MSSSVLAIGHPPTSFSSTSASQASGSSALRRQVSINEITHAHASAPSSLPAKRAFLRLRQMGRMARSTALMSIPMRQPSDDGRDTKH